jgi:hypothetical protein
VIKYRYFLDFEKEEQWLNRMARQGYEFTGKNMFSGYSFRRSQPKETCIRIDYRTFKRPEDFQDYRQLFEDSGWRLIAGGQNSYTQYFARTGDGAEDEIFSDQASKAGRYKRLSNMWLTWAAVYFPIMVALLSSGAVDVQAILNPKLLYYTPGLWEKTSWDFWRAFIFETPFALMRGFAWLIFLLYIALYLYFAARAYCKYRRGLQLH